MNAHEIVKEPRAPFPYFGGKRNVAQTVWNALGDCAHYVEPFLGSAAILLARPASHNRKLETVNDKQAMLANVWRAIRYAPDELAKECAIPVMEVELHARLAKTKARMYENDFIAWIEGDEKHFDVYHAANWLYCTCASIGEPWADKGSWSIVDGHLRQIGADINRKLPHIGDAGVGINRELPRIGGADESHEEIVRQYLRALARRLERVRICCGDWIRVVKTDSTIFAGQENAGIFLDPPYKDGEYLYTHECCLDGVQEWCIKHGQNPRIRIVLAGYESDGHNVLLEHGWTVQRGQAGGSGYQKETKAETRERLWFSPHCVTMQHSLF